MSCARCAPAFGGSPPALRLARGLAAPSGVDRSASSVAQAPAVNRARRLRLALATVSLLAPVLTSVLAPGAAAAQATELGRQALGRPYWHVFIAYALVWLLIGGWVVSIARCLTRVERRLDS